MSFLGSGATESIASFEALEEIMKLRQMRFGQEDLVAHAKQKPSLEMVKQRWQSLLLNCHKL